MDTNGVNLSNSESEPEADPYSTDGENDCSFHLNGANESESNDSDSQASKVSKKSEYMYK